MSTSLNVVSIANVFCESFRRVATRFLSLVIGTYVKKQKEILISLSNDQKTDSFLKEITVITVLTRLSLSLGGS